jgi:tRNA G10  N-methylase Trm11
MEAVFHINPNKILGAAELYDAPLKTEEAVKTLGGLVKAGDIIWHGPKSSFNVELLAEHIKKHPRQDKILFGLTVYAETKKDETNYKYFPISLKKALKSTGRKIRWVTGEKGEIRPVTIEKMKLIDDGYDFNIIVFGKSLAVGLTTAVQDATNWSEKDYGRPFRDAKTGMLPPKLARIMVNLAIDSWKPKTGNRKLLDPFCGGGAILMEASARDPKLELIGSDIDDKQVHGAVRNMQWLRKQGLIPSEKAEWLTTSAQKLQDKLRGPIHYIVTEGFLGRPLQGHESKHDLEMNKLEVEKIWSETLPILASLQTKGGRLVCVWPEYHVRHEVVSIDMSAAAKKAGYAMETKKGFVYGRPGQFVKRKIVILEKK